MIIEENTLLEVFNRNYDVIKTAVEFRVSIQTIMASLTKFGIGYTKPKHIYSDLKKVEFSKFQNSILIGSLLGDGHLEKRGHLKNAMFREAHCLKQSEWLKWKYNNLKPFTTAAMWEQNRGEQSVFPDGHGGKKLYNIDKVINMSTIPHPHLTYLHEYFYRNGSKVMPFDLIEKEFDWLAFATFWCDDGCFTEDCVRFCTDNFRLEEVDFLAAIFSKFYKGRISVRTHKSNTEDKYRIVFTDIKSDSMCFETIRSIIPKCMHYKLPLVPNEHQTATH